MAKAVQSSVGRQRAAVIWGKGKRMVRLLEQEGFCIVLKGQYRFRELDAENIKAFLHLSGREWGKRAQIVKNC
jgi:hypothetical protein